MESTIHLNKVHFQFFFASSFDVLKKGKGLDFNTKLKEF